MFSVGFARIATIRRPPTLLATVLAACAVLAALLGLTGFRSVQDQTDTYESVSKKLIEIMESKELRKLPPISNRLAKLKDPAAIPLMIAAIAADDSHNTIFGLGNFGLETMTEVKYDENHNGEWWLNWWEKNKSKYPKEVREAALPKFKGYEEKSAAKKVPIQDKLLSFCASHMGQKVGTGQEFYDLEISALSFAHGQGFVMKKNIPTWGKLVYRREIVDGHTIELPNPEAKLKIVAGDIVEYREVTFDWTTPGGGHWTLNFGGPDHADIIMEVTEEGGHWKTYDQGINSHRYVENFDFPISSMKAGWLEVYEPQPK